MVKISSYIQGKNIAFLEAKTREEVLDSLVDLLYLNGEIKNKNEFLFAVKKREAIVSTGIGMGVAIPHAKFLGFKNFFIAIGILSEGVDWEAMDGIFVRLVFLIGGPDQEQTKYLQILSKLTYTLKDEMVRRKLLREKSQEEITKIFKGF